MATYYSASAMASFKTAYLQREVVLDVYPLASEIMTVGQVFSMSGTAPAPLIVASQASASGAEEGVIAAVSVGMYIVAQGDQTMEYGHVPVENADYRYDPKVYLANGVHKKIAAFQIVNLADLDIEATTAVSYSA